MLVAASALCAACSGGGGGGSSGFSARTAGPFGVLATTRVAIAGTNLAYLADESATGPAGTDLNGDGGPPADVVAIAVNTVTNVKTALRAAQDIAWIGSHLYLVVSEADDGHEWNSVLGDQLVLLHWTHGQVGDPDFIDTLATAGTVKMVAVGTLLFYSAETTPAGATLSNLKVISSADPLVAATVATTDATAELSPRIVGKDEGLVVLALDETAEARDLNGDGDFVPDDLVLALLDGTGVVAVGAYAEPVRSTGLAIPSVLAPFRAKKTAAHDWQVGFLVDEGAQGATNFNTVNPLPPVELTPSWQPFQCPTLDSDASDDVLFFLIWSDWTDLVTPDAPRNTGLVGNGGSDGVGQIAIAGGFVAVISSEADENGCDLNADGDLVTNDDDVVRMTQIVARPAAIFPVVTQAHILALSDVPGGTHGLAELDARFVISVSEAEENQDLNQGGLGDHLLAWIVPAAAPAPWDFTHGESAPHLTYVGASWLSEQPDRSRLTAAYEEKVKSPGVDGALGTPDDIGGVSINTIPASNPGDNDILDSVPTFPDFIGGHLSFRGVAIAVDDDNAGVEVVRGFLFYRVDEDEDDRDWNADVDETDFVLRTTSLSSSASATVGTLNAIAGRSSLEYNRDETPAAAAFVTDESMVGIAGTDVNLDGRIGLIVQYIRF